MSEIERRQQPSGRRAFDEIGDATRRTRLANERTYLAWWRTGLTALAVSFAAGKLLPELTEGAKWPYEVVGVAFALVGIRTTLVGPPALLPRELPVEMTTDIDAIRDADVVYVLRMQNERMQAGANYVPSLREYTARWGVTPARLRPGQKVMHPGPMNRGVEIDSDVADLPRSVIEEQVTNGIAIRMALLYLLLGAGEKEPA